MPEAVNEGAWIAGLVAGAIVVVVVAAVLITLIALAASIRSQVTAVKGALEEARDGAEGLRELERTEVVTRRVLEAAPGTGGKRGR